jgi:tetratricopeptide (TPR) repeat protein
MRPKIFFFGVAFLALSGCASMKTISQKTTPETEISTDASIKFDPQNSELHFKKGVELLSSGNDADLRLAKVAFQIALRENPNDPDYYQALAATLQQLGDEKGSLSAFLRSQQLIPKDEVDYDKIAALAFRAGYFPMSYTAMKNAQSSEQLEQLQKAFKGGSIKIKNLSDVETDFQLPSDTPEEEDNGLDHKVRVDVLLLLHEEKNFVSRGMDTMGQLNLLVSGDILDYESSRDLISGDRSESRDQSLKFSLGETINYGLNIFRDADSTFRLETAPTVILQEGESTEFSAITETFALTYNDDTGELDDADSFLETGLALEMSANEISDQFVSLDVSISDGEITNIQNSSEATNALNSSLLTAEKVEYKTTIDIPFGPVVPLAEFRGNVSDKTGAGTRRLRDVQLFGKLFGVSTNDVSSKNALILISASKMDVLTAKTVRDNAYKIFQEIYEGDILTPPTLISLLPNAVAPIEYRFRAIE